MSNTPKSRTSASDLLTRAQHLRRAVENIGRPRTVADDIGTFVALACLSGLGYLLLVAT